MANLQIQGVDENLYSEVKKLAAAENRSGSEKILCLAREYLVKKKTVRASKTPAQMLLDLSGSCSDDRTSEEITREIKRARRSGSHPHPGHP